MSASRLLAKPRRASRGLASSPFHAALIDLCFERGYSRVTVESLCRRAGVGRASFNARYDGLDDCVFEVWGHELERLRHRISAARARYSRWSDRLRVTIYTLYRHLEEDERSRRFATVEVRTAGERASLLVAEEIELLSDLLDEGRLELTAAPSLSRATAEWLAGGIFDQIFGAARRGGSMPPEGELVPQLMYVAVLPYLGKVGAAEELDAPPPPR